MQYHSSAYTDLTDEELIHLVQEGNEIAFGQLAARHSSRIWRLVILNSRQTRDAEEICQDIWVAVWENISKLRKVSSFGAWLQKIAYTTCKRYYTLKSHTSGEILQEEEELAETIDQDALVHFRETELRADVTEAVHHLPEKVRPVAVLYYLELWTIKEVAEQLGLAVGTVKTRLRDIRALLRKEFDVEEVKTQRKPSSQRTASKSSRRKTKGDFGMELTFEREALLPVLRALQTITDKHHALPTNSDILIRAKEGTIDLEVSIKMKVEGTVKTEGAVAVSAQKLIRTLKALPAGAPIDFVATADHAVEIACGDNTYKITRTPGEALPQLPSIEDEVLSISGETLRDAIRKTAYAASTEDSRSFLKSVYFNCLEDRTEIVATDGKRLALTCCEPLNLQGKTNGFIVPIETIREIPKTFPESVEVEISVSGNQLRFTDGKATLRSQLVDREYPDYQRIIPQASQGKTVVSRDQILGVTERMATHANPKIPAICLDIRTERIRVSAKAPESPEAHETVPVESGTGSVRIGFDARLLIEALSHIDSESVCIEFSRELDPVLIKPIGDDKYIVLIMPLKLSETP